MLFRQILVLQLLLISTCFSQNTLERQTLWQSIGIKDGLSQGMVNDMMQDRDGFMWIATKDGLNRYDGYNFKVFTNDPYNENSISGNNCTALLEDKQGRIWIGTERDGLNLFDKKTQRFYHAKIIDASLKNAGNYYIHRFKLDSLDAVWIFTDDPSKVFKTQNFKGLPANEDFTPQIKKIKETEFQQNITLNLDRQSLRYRFAKAVYEKKQPDIFEGVFLENSGFSNYLKDNQNWIWVLGKTKIYGRKGNLKKEISFEGGEESSVINQFEDGTLVIANQEYMWLFSPQELLKTDQLSPQNAYAQIPANCILFTKDRDGNVWIGTRGYGLLKYNPQDRQFKSYLPTYSPSFLFRDMEGRTYFHANYLPTYHFYEYNTNNNTYNMVLPKVSGKALGHEGILQDKTHQFWLLCNKRFEKKQVLMKFTKDWKLLKEYILPSLDVFSDFEAKMNLDDNQGNIWIGLTNGSLYLFNPQTEQVKIYNYRSLLPQNGAFVQTFALFLDQNNIWIGTQKGLIKGENLTTKPTFSIFKNSKTNRQSLSNDFVSGIINDPFLPQKYLWVSTKGGGLERLDKTTGIFEHFTEAQGLPNKVVYGVLEGDDKNLWMSTNRGIARLNTQRLNFTNFNKSDGIQDDEFNTNSYFKAPTGELLFGGVNGFTVFRASAIGQIKTLPELKIIGLKVNNKIVELNDETGILNDVIETLPKLNLSYNQNLLTLEFGLMNFTNPVKNRFRYQLEGIDDEWVEAGTNHFANYAQLPSGNYTFKVMGTTDGEVWSKTVELQIHVRPPFYRSWWAYLIYISILGYVLYRWNLYQINQVRLQQEVHFKNKEADRLVELDQLKTKFFTNISHELRTPLTLILAPIQGLLNESPDKKFYQIINRNASRLLDLINQLLDLTKLEAGEMTVNVEETNLSKYFRTLTSSFNSLAESKGIIFEFAQSHNNMFGAIDKDKVEKIITNLLSNAFKFTEKDKKVSTHINYSTDNKTITLQINDEGIGIPKDKKDQIFNRFYQIDGSLNRKYDGTGIGLALVKELLDVLDGRISVESTEGFGTSFTLTFACVLQIGNIEGTEALATLAEPTKLPAQHIIPETPDADSDNILLIVDDNEDIRDYIRTVFEKEFKIIEAVNGIDGLAKATASLPNLIISDLMMPEMDGFEFCKALKSDEKTSHIPIIMLTAKANVESRIEGFELGADEYLIKPFNTTEIKARVKNLLEKQENLRLYYSQKIIKLKPNDIKVTSKEEVFLKKVMAVIDKNLSDNRFGVEQFSAAMDMSQSQLVRKLKALTNLTGNEFIRDFRLQRAAELLEKHAGTISEIALQVGFENHSYFAKVFHEKFGKLPSDY